MARRVYTGWPVVINDLDLTELDSLTVTENLTVGGKGIIGSAVSDSIGLYGVGPVSQRRSNSQASVAALTSAQLTVLTTVAGKVNSALVLLNRLRADLIAVGAIKGSA
jgi:hypothetical protein